MIKFREALLSKLDETGTSLRQVAAGSGVSYEQLKKLKQIQSRSTNVEDAIRVAAFFGLTVDEFMTGEQATSQGDIVTLLQKISPEAREFLINAAKAQLAAEDTSLQKFPEKPE